MQVVLKIIKHCQQALPGFVNGQLLGLDIGRTLEVTNCFPFPGKDSGETDDDSAEYQMEMMRCLREVNVDNNTVGWYGDERGERATRGTASPAAREKTPSDPHLPASS